MDDHLFIKKTFHKPTYCHHCTELLWGLIGQGYYCQLCNFICHEKCIKFIISSCLSFSHSLIKNPVEHCWSDYNYFKRKFCNVCRKRLDDSLAVKCEICEYYCHVNNCQELAINDCLETSTYVPNKRLDCILQDHHWREGNLPSNSKCIICKKSCWSYECLTSYRCEWCGITSHSSCRNKITESCQFGSLRDIIVPPFAVSVPRININKKEILGINNNYKSKDELQLNDNNLNATLNELRIEASSFNDQQTSQIISNININNSVKSTKNKLIIKDDELLDSKEIIKLFDGDVSFRNNSFKLISISKNSNYNSILEYALRVCHINDDLNKYYLAIPVPRIDDEIDEILIDELCPMKSIKSSVANNCLLLRYKNDQYNQDDTIKIYISNNQNKYKQELIDINLKTTAKEIIKYCLLKNNENNNLNKNEDDYYLIQVQLNNSLNEFILNNNEYPLKQIKQLRRESLCKYNMCRYYLKIREQNEDDFAISLFIGNLPIGLSELQYEKLLMEYLDDSLKWIKIDCIYYEYGSLIVVYDSLVKANKTFNLLKEVNIDVDKQLIVLILPKIQPNMITSNKIPLLVFVNVKSGGQQGIELINSFRNLLNPHQVFDLHNGGPLPGLYVFRNIDKYRILACGGDGTIGWILSCLDNISQDAKCESPAMAVLPIGTGNDLARVLRWGAGYTGTQEPINILRDIINADEVRLDRWTVVFHLDDNNSNNLPPSSNNLFQQQQDLLLTNESNSNSINTNEDNTEIYVMNNYFGIGIDADVSLDFHMAREENPNKFNSRLMNKKYYFQIGLRKIMNKACNYSKDFNKNVCLEVDGKKIDLPQIEANKKNKVKRLIYLLVFSNGRWGSGANPWGTESDNQYQKPTHYDGMLEVVGVKGIVHMGQIKSGMTNAIRLAQGERIKIKVNTEIPVQVDGEPWLQLPCSITIIKSALKATMLKKNKYNNKLKRRNTEPNVNFTLENVQDDGDSEPF